MLCTVMDKQEINQLIQRIKGHHLPVRIENSISKKNAYDTDLQKLLELLCYTVDMDLKIKIFSTLAAYLLSKEVNYKTVVTHLPVYDEVQNVIRNGLTLSNTNVLYFVSALLSIDIKSGSQKSTLVIFAQNALRVSGCLATMADLFTRDMMYQDSWLALCRSIADTCRGSELNQTYCSYLVPVCVRKCFQGNMEACIVLQSLLLNHDRNIQLFLNCNGTSIFSRKTLQYDMCLHLLDTIVQRSQQAATLLLETDVVYNLRAYLEMYGPESKIGKWSTIILYHINSWCQRDTIKDKESEMDTDTKGPDVPKKIAEDSVTVANGNESKGSKNITQKLQKNETITNKSHQHNPDDTKELLQNIVREMAYWKKEKEKKTLMKQKNKTRHDLANTIDQSQNDDTDLLLKNIAGEIAYGKLLQSKKNEIVNDQLRNLNMAMNLKQTPEVGVTPSVQAPRYMNTLMNKNPTNKMADLKENPETSSNDLSFSFLLDQKNYMKRNNVHDKGTDQDNFVAKPNLTTRQFSRNFRNQIPNTNNQNERSNNTKLESSHSITGCQSSKDELSSRVMLRRFNPSFASTPKRTKATMSTTKTSQPSRSSTKISQLSRTSFKRSKASSTSKSHWQMQLSRLEESNKSTATSIKKRQSMSARLFTAINESCTTFVKSVKGIFKGSSQTSESKPNHTKKEMDALTCSFSFTNYMRKRDAILGNNGTKYTEAVYDSMEVTNESKSCKTCNETELLRKKLATDEHLKETVKKLKYGINLYGCDFKKISMVLWANDKVMTHRVLYQLYRKLLAK